MSYLYSSLWFVAIAISVAMFWIRKYSIRAWMYVALGVLACSGLVIQLVWLHNTVSVFICGGYTVMATYCWIRMRELMEREKLAKEKQGV